MNHHIRKQQRIDWWRVSGGVYTVVAVTNLVFAISMLTIPEKRVALTLALATASNMFFYAAAFVMPAIELIVITLIPYLFFKHSEWAIKLTFVIYILEGVLKILLGLKTGNVVHIIGGGFFAFISSFFIFMIKHHKPARSSTPTTRHKKRFSDV
jgi:hypothetical protein